MAVHRAAGAARGWLRPLALAALAALAAAPHHHNAQNTPLHAAARRGDLERVTQLVDQGFRRCDEARLPYIERQACYHSGTVDNLGESAPPRSLCPALPACHTGADGAARCSSDGWAPIHEAANSGHDEVITYLLSQNAQIDSRTRRGSTPLMWAAMGGHTSSARLLIAHGANIDATDHEGKSVMDYAPQQRKESVLAVSATAALCSLCAADAALPVLAGMGPRGLGRLSNDGHRPSTDRRSREAAACGERSS